ncbi:MAG TPA: glycosyltransferase [Trichocoleus sp.]
MIAREYREYKVVAFITAYLDSSALMKIIPLIESQTFPVAEIFIIDNSPDLLIRTQASHIKIRHFPNNVGVAGGLLEGFREVLESKYDFLWMFDQDSEPAENCLEELLNFWQKAKYVERLPVGIVSPLVFDANTYRHIGGAIFEKFRFREKLPSLTDCQSFMECDSPITSGSLFSVEVIKKDFSPRRELFMDGVDLDYGMQLRRNGFQNFIVKAAKMNHRLGSPLKIRFWGKELLVQNYSPIRTYYFFRNHTYLEIYYSSGALNKGVAVLRRIAYMVRGILAAIIICDKKINRVRACFMGTLSGLFGVLERI